MNTTTQTLLASLVQALDLEEDSMPEGFELESTAYTVTFNVQDVQTCMARANMEDKLQYNQVV